MSNQLNFHASHTLGLIPDTFEDYQDLITHANDSRGSKASIGVCHSVRVCPHDKTKTAESKITKLGTGIVHH